jgi:rhamnosyltransferase
MRAVSKEKRLPKISIVVRCFNEEAHLGKLFHGIARQTERDVEVILVDSGSTDRSVEIARAAGARVVGISPEAFSFGRALNIGCSEASGEFLVFASAHVYPVYPDWLEQLLRPFEHARVAAVYGRQRGAETTKYSEHQIFAHWFPERSVAVQDTPFCNNANCCIRRRLWEEHPYDEALTGLEDLAWARQMVARGFHVSYSAEGAVVHVHNETYEQVFRRYMREAMALRAIYPEQDMSFLGFVQLFLTNTLTDLTHSAAEAQFRERLLEVPAFRFMQFWGAYRGFKRQGPPTERLRRAFYYPRGLPLGRRPAADERRPEPIDYQALNGGPVRRESGADGAASLESTTPSTFA